MKDIGPWAGQYSVSRLANAPQSKALKISLGCPKAAFLYPRRAKKIARGLAGLSGRRKKKPKMSNIDNTSSQTPISDMVAQMLARGIAADVIVLAVRTAELGMRCGGIPVD